MELDADEPRKFQGPPDRILGQPTWVRGEGKSEDSLWRRDLSALGPFGAEANIFSPAKKSNLASTEGLPFNLHQERLGLFNFKRVSQERAGLASGQLQLERARDMGRCAKQGGVVIGAVAFITFSSGPVASGPVASAFQAWRVSRACVG